MNKLIRTAILAAIVLGGCAASSYATLTTMPPATPNGIGK